jgi:hypothetical protein
MFLVIKDLERLMNMYFNKNYDGFITDIAHAIQRVYPCQKNEGETPLLTSDSVTDEKALSRRWRVAADCHQLPKIMVESVADDLDYIQAQERSVRRLSIPEYPGAYGIVDLFDRFSGDDILRNLIETGNRRLSLVTEGSPLGEDILYLEKEPCELDIAWLMAKGEMKYRYIAFPWKEKIKVLVVGNHLHADSYFGESWVFGYSWACRPEHIVDCYAPSLTPWHSSYTKFSAFVVDERENIKGAVEILNLMEHLVHLVNMMALTCNVTSNSDIPWPAGKTREESAKDLILSISGLSRKTLKSIMREYVLLYRKIQAHEFYVKGAIASFVYVIVESSAFYGGVRLLRRSGIEEILGTSLDNVIEE